MNKMFVCLASAAVVLIGQPAQAQPRTLAIFEIHYAEQDPVPMCIPLSLPAEFADVTHVELNGTPGRAVFKMVGQLTKPGLLTESIAASAKGLVRRDLYFVMPAGQAPKITFKVLEEKAHKIVPKFAWQTKKGEYAELLSDGIPVLRYMHMAYDKSTAENHDKTYKVFHHLYDPAGKRLVTNGGQTNDHLPNNPKDLLYPHHRGLMFAFNRITYDGNKTCDTWHAKPGDTHQSHEGFLATEAGMALGRHRVAVDWHGPMKEVFAKEERELTVFKVGKGTLVEFVSRLKTAGGKVKLDGDPQHAGFQFRAHNDLVEQKNNKLTYYLRPDGKGEPGQTRNWDPKNKGPVNLPWDACSFVLDGKRYTAVYLSHPANPKESRWSERDYGRFGCYFEYELTEKNPLVVHYRVWLQDGEMTVAECAALYRGLVGNNSSVLMIKGS